MDAVRDFARPLSFKVIADLLGIAPNMFSFVRTWSEQLTRIVLTLNSLDELMLLDVASREFSDYLKYLIAYRKRDPGDDLISTFCIDRRAKHEQLTDAELISMCIVMSMANVQTTTAFLGVGLFELLKHPDQLRRLRENPDLLASAVDELLRFDGSQHFVSRTALEDIEIGGKLISAGEEVYLGLGCANRDQMRFEEADQLVFERQRNRHLAFGDGAHWCVGAHLARVEAEEAFRALLEVLPDVHLVSSRVEWHPHVLSRGPARLPVRFSARPEIP
jgi:cytochrome P450